MASQSFTYRVTNQTPTSGQDSAGRYGPGMMVTIRTDKSGIMGQLFIPQHEYTPDRNRVALSALAQRLEETHALTGG